MSKTGMERLKELEKDVYRCIHCKACRFAYSGEPDKKGIGEHTGKQGKVLYEGMVDACPAGIEYGWEAYWNAGKISPFNSCNLSIPVFDIFLPPFLTEELIFRGALSYLGLRAF